MQKNPKYDNTTHQQKCWTLMGWLQKTYKKIPVSEMKTLLYDCENSLDQTLDVENQSSEFGDRDDIPVSESADETGAEEYCSQYIREDEQCPDSPDMFDEDSDDVMEIDEPLSCVEKERIVQEYIQKINKNMIENEESLPDFVKNSHIYKRKRDEFVLNYSEQLLESTSSQDLAMN